MIQRNQFKRSALALAIGLTMAGAIQAQTNTAGAVSGQAKAGDTITVTSSTTGLTRTVTVGSDGVYRMAQLPTGSYKLTRNGSEARDIRISVGTTTNIDFSEATSLETVTVTGGAINPIDISSVESTVVLTEAQIDTLPVARDTTSMALLAPGTTLGDSRLGDDQKQNGKLASFGGSSVAENVYYINGFNVTNLINGVAFSELPFEAISETQVKNGGYGAEFGRSLGGVVNVIGKRGSNEWHFGGNAIYSPDSMRSSSIRFVPANPDEADGQWAAVNTDSYSDSMIYNAYASGPIVDDRLFFYVLGQATDTNQRSFSNVTQSETTSDAPMFYGNVNWYITDNHILEVTAFRDREEQEVGTWNSVTPYGRERASALLPDAYQYGGDNYIAKWTGYFGDNLTFSALYGIGKYDHTSQVGSASCNYVSDRRAAVTVRHGCWTTSAIDNPDANEERDAYRIDGEWRVSDHTLRFGLDNEQYDFLGGRRYTGDGGVRLIRRLAPGATIANSGYTNTTGAPLDYVSIRTFRNGGVFTLENSAWYVEDTWQITDNFLAYGGIRNESFTNKNDQGMDFIKIDNTWAPRLGFSWDVRGDASLKLFGNAGRYYIPVMGNTNLRLSGTEYDVTQWFAFDGTFSNDIYENPGLGAQLGNTFVASDGLPKDPRTVVDPDIKPMFQDEYILGFQMQLSDNWVGGVRTVYRDLSTVMDDYCSYSQPYEWALANGYSEAEADVIGTTVTHCFLMNVGEDLHANVDLGGADLTLVTIPADALGLPKAKRTYKAAEFFFERVFDGKWTVQGSYTWSKSWGNTEGYVKSDIGQDDAGISAGYDYPSLADGGLGYLPNDRRHAVKVFGSYQVNDEWRLGANVLIQSGRPLNCLGAVPQNEDGTWGDGHWLEEGYAGYAMYCNGELVPRGTAGRLQWQHNFGLNVTYQPEWLEGLRLSADVFNLTNDREVTAVNEQCEFEFGATDPGCYRPLSLVPARSVRFTVEFDY
ncbi:MAG: hypothetical protein IPG63_09810 [Xanthomonadales bacterium]|nr:hypothetical protein [Xanthomonadales bacterium]